MKAGKETGLYNQGYMDGYDDAQKAHIDPIKPKIKDVKEKSFPKDEDYWTRLEHTYAGMAMQGILSNQTYTKHLLETSTSAKDARDIIVDASKYLAHALVEKMKEERK